MGFKQGEVFGMILPNLPEFPIILLGAAGIGMPVTTVNSTYTVEEIARQLQLSGATVVVTIPELAGTLRQVAQQCPEIRRLLVVGKPEEGFASLEEMLQDNGDLFDDNIKAWKHYFGYKGRNNVYNIYFYRSTHRKTFLYYLIQGSSVHYFTKLISLI